MASKTAAEAADHAHGFHDDIIYPSTIPFVLVHLAAFGAIWSGVTLEAALLAVVLYLARMFGATAGYHRYFSHRAYKTSRVGQFLLAVLAQSSLQKGVLWWSAQHRHHHRHSDTPEDLHSPGQSGFFFAHLGWIFSRQRSKADYSLVKDLAKYPELRFLDRFQHLPGILLALGCYAVAGWPGLFVGFFVSTVVLFHCTFAINSLAHVVGKQRYVTGDDSRNNWWLAIITLGEGWHNNHHYYMSATRQGFRWYEFDPTYYVLKALSWTGLVWDLREPPAEVVRGDTPLGRRTLEKVAAQLAASVPVAAITRQLRETRAHAPDWEDLRKRFRESREQAARWILERQLPQIPSVDELRARAAEMFPTSPGIDEIVQRARELIAEQVAADLLESPAPANG